MKLDPRIENEFFIYTPFSNAKTKLHEKGYFADDMMSFSDLDNCVYGELEDYDINLDYPYKCKTDKIEHAFFIPESKLKPVEKFDEITILKYKIEKLEKNLTELQRRLNNQKTICNPFTPWTNCCASISYPDGFNPQANWCSNNGESMNEIR